MKNTFVQSISALIILVFVFLAIGSSPDPSRRRKKKPQTEESISSNPNLTETEKADLISARKKKMDEERKTKTVSSLELIEAYEANEVSADDKYKNKVFYVEGYIDDIGKDLFDKIYVSLEGSDEIFRSVSCSIDDAKVVATLKKGQWLAIRGRCDGLMLDVQMEDCEIIEIRDESPEEEEEEELTN